MPELARAIADNFLDPYEVEDDGGWDAAYDETLHLLENKPEFLAVFINERCEELGL